MKIPTLSQVLKYFKLVMTTTTAGHRVQQIWKAPKGTVVKVTIELMPHRFRFGGRRYHSKNL